MSRTILVAVAVTVRDDDSRTTDEVASWIERGLEAGLEGRAREDGASGAHGRDRGGDGAMRHALGSASVGVVFVLALVLIFVAAVVAVR